MKKYYVIMTVITMLMGGVMTISAESKCPHIHDKNCGYDERTETGCTHDCEKGGHPCNPRSRATCMYCPD